mmetsp:Transcript_136150/g.240639  ORF Transcript_136150/g.240639 Transcript_136150/m.240639 type:complete len:206 (-) Transcript_136150:349-966(-)
MGNSRVTRNIDLATAQPYPYGLLYVLGAPHPHLVIILTRLVPPLPGYSEQTAAHARHNIVEVFEPLEEQCPIKHHLGTHRIVVWFPRLPVQNWDQRHNYPLVVDVHVLENRLDPIPLGLDMCVQEHDCVTLCQIAALCLRLYEAQPLFVADDLHLREVFTGVCKRRLAAIIYDNDLLQDVSGCALIDGLQSALHVLMLIMRSHHN